MSWVSRRLALVELLPEAIQQQVREGAIAAQLAMKFLVPMARQSLEDCQRMAAIFAGHGCDTRAAGQLYAAWRRGSAAIRKRILSDPALFFRTQRQEKAPPGAAADAVVSDITYDPCFNEAADRDRRKSRWAGWIHLVAGKFTKRSSSRGRPNSFE